MPIKYKDWEARHLEYCKTHDLLVAWHLANRDFGIGRKEYEIALTKPVMCDILPPYDKEEVMRCKFCGDTMEELGCANYACDNCGATWSIPEWTEPVVAPEHRNPVERKP